MKIYISGFQFYPLTSPPLRSRGNDTEVLSRYFNEKYCRKMCWQIPDISPEAQKIINKYNWPGNVRQLQNAINYAINTAQDNVINANNLPDYILLDNSHINLSGTTTTVGQLDEVLSIKKLEKAAIDLALLQSHNSIPRAASLLGMSKATLYRKLKEYTDNE